MKIAINGFGRIGRSFLRVLLESGVGDTITVSCINIGPARIEDTGYLLTYDSIMGALAEPAVVREGVLWVGQHRIPIIAEPNPAQTSWQQYGIEWVVECSGHFTKKKDAALHVQAGAQNVLISAPSVDADVCVIPGVNMEHYEPKQHTIVSLGSCTTNAFFPLLAGIQKIHQIEYGCMTTIHAYTNSQALLDVDTGSADVRRFRAAAQNMIPTSTGAAKLVAKIFPALTDKIEARAVRVPLPNVSLIDLQLVLTNQVCAEEVNMLFSELAAGELDNILAVSHEPLVSSDYLGSSYSVTVDAALTACVGPVVKLFGWYDNEWGYSCRLLDFLLFAADLSGR